MTQYTENYRLELYEGTDKADLTDQYNVSMGILDGAMKGVVDDTDASVAGIRADLATTNSNLNATNINLTALDQKVDSNQTAQAATNLNFQNEIDTLKTTVDAVPGTYATQEALAALKTEVDKNTPLVEEHVNYFADLGVTDEQSATDLHTQIDNTYQGLMSNTAAIEEMRAQLSPWKQFGTVTIKNKNWPFYSCGTFACIHINDRLDLGRITGGTTHNEPFDLPSGFYLPYSWNTTPQSPVLIFDGSPNADVAFARVSISRDSAVLSITVTKDYTSAYLLGTTMVVFPVTTEPPQEAITFAAYPDLSSANGGVGTTGAKFSGSVDEGGKLVMGNLTPFYNFASALGSGEVSLPTRKIVIANIASNDVAQVPTSVRVYSATLSGSQTYPVSCANGELSFTPTADNNSLGQHTGAATTNTLILSLYYSYDTTPNPPTEPTATATFGAVPSLETDGGNDGSTTAKFSGSIAGKKLTVNNLSATYEFTSRLGEDIVYMPTSKIVVATVENGTGVEVPTSVKVSSSALESSQTYPLTYVDGVLSFTPTAQTRGLGAHTGGTSTKELTLVMEFIANGGGGSMTPNPPITDPEEPKLNGIYPIALSGSRKPGSSNAIQPFEIKGTISYNEGVVSEVTLNQGSGVLCVLKSDNPAYATALVEVSGLEITGEHVPNTLTFNAQLFQDNVRATQTVEFTKTGNKLVANNFRLIGNLQAAQNGFGQARLSFIPA